MKIYAFIFCKSISKELLNIFRSPIKKLVYVKNFLYYYY